MEQYKDPKSGGLLVDSDEPRIITPIESQIED